MISISPDPRNGGYGYAVISLPEAELPDGQTQVAIYDNYGERFLGQSGWQASKVFFGPYDVVHEGGEARLVIGPEIVNQIAEYTPVKLMVGNVEADTSWPEDVLPAPGAAKIGDILTRKPEVKVSESRLKARIEEPVAEPEPQPEPEPVAPAPPPPPPPEPAVATEEKPKSKAMMIVALLALLLPAGALAYWYFGKEDIVAVAPPDPPDPTPPPVETRDPCSMDALAALEGFATQADALRGCAGDASADAALGLVEQAAAAGDPQALFLFGTIYDGGTTEAVIEEQIGLTFGDVPHTAAEYYSRAATAGSQAAVDRLETLCTRMATMTDTLTQGAYQDYCSN